MNPIEKLKNWIWPERKPAQSGPGEHEHNFSGMELPTDMGRKVVASCVVKGCYEVQVRAASAAEREETAPLASQVRAFQENVLGDVEDELNKRPRR
jgi:hypothetical protein